MLRRWANTVLFDYHGKPDKTLYRHYTVLRVCAHTCLWSMVCAFTLLADFLFSHALYRVVAPWAYMAAPFLLAAFFTIAALLMPILFLAFPLTRDIEEALTARGLPLPRKRFSEDRFNRSMLKVILIAALIFLWAYRLKNSNS